MDATGARRAGSRANHAALEVADHCRGAAGVSLRAGRVQIIHYAETGCRLLFSCIPRSRRQSRPGGVDSVGSKQRWKSGVARVEHRPGGVPVRYRAKPSRCVPAGLARGAGRQVLLLSKIAQRKSRCGSLHSLGSLPDGSRAQLCAHPRCVQQQQKGSLGSRAASETLGLS